MWYEFFTSLGAISIGMAGSYLSYRAYNEIKKHITIPPYPVEELKKEMSLRLDEISGRIYEGGFPKSEILREKDKLFVLNSLEEDVNKLKRKTIIGRRYVSNILKDIEEMKRRSEMSLRDKKRIEEILSRLEI